MARTIRFPRPEPSSRIQLQEEEEKEERSNNNGYLQQQQQQQPRNRRKPHFDLLPFLPLP